MDSIDFDNLNKVRAMMLKRSTLAIERAYKDLINQRGYYLNIARRKFNILADMPIDKMHKVGYAIMNNLDKVYSYDFIILFFKSLTEVRDVRFYHDDTKAGMVRMAIGVTGVEADIKVTNSGDNKVTATGDRKVCNRVEAKFNAVDLDTYLYQFYNFGILQDKIHVINIPEHLIIHVKTTSDGVVKTTSDRIPKTTEGVF